MYDWKRCVVCNKLFLSSTPNQICCTKEYSVKRNRDRNREITQKRNKELKEHTVYKAGNTQKQAKSRFSIIEIQQLARERGMSYGQFVALSYLKGEAL